jgi:tetratricopeptide (TPR) repeat protein
VIRSALVLITVLAFAAAAFEVPDGHRAVIDPAVRGILECRFDDVLKLTDSVYASGVNRPIAAVLHLAALGMRDVDFDTQVDPAAFMRSFARARAAVDSCESAGGVTSYTLTLRGFALGMHASFHLKNRAYIAAAGTGLDAIKVMREAKELDSANAEVNFFLGLYDYARTDLKRRLPAVMFWFPGDRASGIRLLEQGARSAAITQTASALALSDIYVKEGQPRRALAIINRLKRELPDSRFVLWAEVKYNEDRKMFSEAAQIYGRLADMYEREPHGAYNAAVTRNRQAHAHNRAGETEAALSAGKRLQERRGGAATDRRTSGVIRDTERLLQRLERNR